MQKGKLIIITGPSTAGKTTTTEQVMEKTPGSARLITTTTRAPREGEVDGVDYYFVPREEFVKRSARGEFFETAENYGNFYGSSSVTTEEMLMKHPFVFGILDVQGARAVKESVPNAQAIFLLPDITDIGRRLRERAGVNEEETKRRLERAMDEMGIASEFDHIVKNRKGEQDQTVEEILNIINHP